MRQGRLVELVGEPGIGKSRLVEELKTLAVGFNQLTAACERYATSIPFYPFRENLRPLAGIMPGLSPEEAGAHLQSFIPAVMPDLAPWLPLLAIPFDAKVEMTPETEAIDEKFRRDKLHEALEQFFMRMFLMPTLMIFEDSHWMDDSTRFALAHLMANPLGRPWLVVVTRRPEGEPVCADGRGRDRSSSRSTRRRRPRLALAAAEDAALSRRDGRRARRTLRRQPALRARARRGRAQRHRDATRFPESVETLITTRIDRLDARDRMLLRYAAVIGPSFDLELLTAALGGDIDDVGDLERWRRLGEFVGWDADDVLRFRHDLFRATAYGAFVPAAARDPPARRRGARAARRRPRRRGGGGPVAALLRGRRVRAGLAVSP